MSRLRRDSTRVRGAWGAPGAPHLKMISREAVEHAARLARLQLDEAELERMREQLSSILAFVDQLGRLDTAAVEPTSHAVPLVNVMREDTVEPSFPPEVMLANAPDPDGNFFRVPRIIED